MEDEEDCDTDNLDGATCASLPIFDGGTLACDSMCVFDTTGCFRCGDGDVDFGEECDGVNLNGSSCIDRGFTGGDLACSVGCMFDEVGCLDHPDTGEVIFTEIMKDPVTVADGAGGEWLELFNTSGTTFDLAGCTLVSTAPATIHAIASALVIPAGGYVTLAEFSIEGPGFVPNYFWMPGDLPLADGDGSITLFCDGGPGIDSVIYDSGAEFPSTAGSSLSLDPTHLSAAENDVGVNWCDGVGDYNGDLGSPGAENPVCATTFTIDVCNLEMPSSLSVSTTDPVTAFGRLTITGLTDLTDGVDTAPEVTAELGVGPDGSDPAMVVWTWTAAAGTPGWDATASGAVGEDEYTATFPAGPNGDYDYAFRFSGDSGATYTYCDLDPGSSDGYAAGDAGQLNVAP